MIDLHSHILPGLDDGARDMDFAIEMAKMAVADGVLCVAATPHNVNVIASDAHTLSKRSPVLSEAVKEASRIMGEDRARALVTTVPQAILNDREVQVEAPLDRGASRGRWLWSR